MKSTTWGCEREDGTQGKANLNCMSPEKNTPVLRMVLVQGSRTASWDPSEKLRSAAVGTSIGGTWRQKRKETGHHPRWPAELAILLHHLWISCEAYEPLHGATPERQTGSG